MLSIYETSCKIIVTFGPENLSENGSQPKLLSQTCVCDNDELLKGVSSAKCMDTKMAMKRGKVIINWPQSRKGAV